MLSETKIDIAMSGGVYRSDSWQISEIETIDYVDVVFLREQIVERLVLKRIVESG